MGVPHVFRIPVNLALLTLMPAVAGAALPAPPQQPAAPRRTAETALDRYVAAPDDHFALRSVGTLPGARDVTVTILELTSQQWLTAADVDRPVWTHWLVVYRPATVRASRGLLFVGGGSNDGDRPEKVNALLLQVAADTNTVTAELRMVPNQPVTFAGDPMHVARKEDAIIAYTWDRYLRTGDERWPLRLPMTKAVVRAMDALTQWTASAEGGAHAVNEFVVAGASKRGWTTWATAAVDRRVIGIVPLVIDVLNVVPSFKHHWQAYGFWAPAVKDYAGQGIMDWMDTSQFAALMTIEDPWSYRDRFTMPKLLVNAAGDQFFLPDSSQFYAATLPGETHLRYVPNTDHSLEGSDARESLEAFYTAIVTGTPRPRVTWKVDPPGGLTVTASDRPTEVRLWQATNPKARDFRLETFGPKWHAATLSPVGPNTWRAAPRTPRAGWTAWFIELTFPSGGRYPFVFTTDVHVTPDRLPFPAPHSSGPHKE
jgi:PhoPQ-activated pathogenicity-related protein